MVLESLTTPERAEKSPWDLFFIGAMYASIAVFLSIWVFREQSSIVMVLLTVLASVPLMYNTMRYEEEKDITETRERVLLREHWKALTFFMCLFVGFVIAFSVAYIFLPAKIVEDAFKAQRDTINNINSQIAGQGINTASMGSGMFFQILSNNLKVMLFSMFFAFFYGAGAIFILTWNASVISAAVGTFFRNGFSEYASSVGLVKIGGYFHILSLSLLRYFVHGLPEILAYFIAGLAGGIISVAVIRHDFGSAVFKRILKDSVDLILLGVFCLIVAAALEVYVTPALF